MFIFVFLLSFMCALGTCVKIYMDVFPSCSYLLFFGKKFQMRKANTLKEVEEMFLIEPARTTNRATLLLSLR